MGPNENVKIMNISHVLWFNWTKKVKTIVNWSTVNIVFSLTLVTTNDYNKQLWLNLHNYFFSFKQYEVRQIQN